MHKMHSKYILVLLFLAGLYGLTQCEKPERIVHLKTEEITAENLTIEEVILPGRVLDEGQGIREFGIAYRNVEASGSIPFTKAAVSSKDKDGLYTFHLPFPGNDKPYEYKAYALNHLAEEVSGEIKQFRSLAWTPPVADITSIVSQTSTSATFSVEVISNGGMTVEERGVCYGMGESPSLDDLVVTDVSGGTGQFEITVDGLQEGQNYCFRAYATNELGTGYSRDYCFTTDGPPTVSTMGADNVLDTSAVCSGTITSENGSEVTDCGIVYSLSSTPWIEGDVIHDDHNGVGDFDVSLEGLLPGTTYYYYAYATNEYGTAGGDTKSFKTLGIPEVSLVSVGEFTGSSFVCEGNVQDDNGRAISSRGFCYGTSPNPERGASEVFEVVDTEADIGQYILTVTGLERGTEYYVRAFAENEFGTGYSDEIFCTTPDQPTVVSYPATSVTANSAYVSGEITSDGGSEVTQYGICINDQPSPGLETSADLTEDGHSGVFGFTQEGLQAGVSYYFRAYAINDIDTAYGEELSFTTLTVPSVTTNALISLTKTSAVVEGEILGNGASDLTEIGLCYSINPGPDISDNTVTVAGDENPYSALITNLSEGTTYYVRAYAVNSFGVGYGEDLSFVTLDEDVTDYEGNTYSIAQIGEQIWMAENLKSGKLNDGTDLSLVTEGTAWISLMMPGYCWYENDYTTYGETYGALYNFIAVGSGKLCPVGWHVPTPTEWTQLIDYLGGSEVAGGKMKTVDMGYWSSPNTGANNISSFSALPGGRRGISSGAFSSINYAGYWWSTQYNGSEAWKVKLQSDIGSVNSSFSEIQFGFSVRCVKDSK